MSRYLVCISYFLLTSTILYVHGMEKNVDTSSVKHQSDTKTSNVYEILQKLKYPTDTLDQFEPLVRFEKIEKLSEKYPPLFDFKAVKIATKIFNVPLRDLALSLYIQDVFYQILNIYSCASLLYKYHHAREKDYIHHKVEHIKTESGSYIKIKLEDAAISTREAAWIMRKFHSFSQREYTLNDQGTAALINNTEVGAEWAAQFFASSNPVLENVGNSLFYSDLFIHIEALMHAAEKFLHQISIFQVINRTDKPYDLSEYKRVAEVISAAYEHLNILKLHTCLDNCQSYNPCIIVATVVNQKALCQLASLFKYREAYTDIFISKVRQKKAFNEQEHKHFLSISNAYIEQRHLYKNLYQSCSTAINTNDNNKIPVTFFRYIDVSAWFKILLDKHEMFERYKAQGIQEYATIATPIKTSSLVYQEICYNIQEYKDCFLIYSSTAHGCYNNIRIFKTANTPHLDVQIPLNYYPSVMLWRTDPDQALTYFKYNSGIKSRLAESSFFKPVELHAFSPIVDYFIPFCSLVQKVKSRKKSDQEDYAYIMAGALTDSNGIEQSGVFIYIKDGKSGKFYHRFFDQRTATDLISVCIQDGALLPSNGGLYNVLFPFLKK